MKWEQFVEINVFFFKSGQLEEVCGRTNSYTHAPIDTKLYIPGTITIIAKTKYI